MFTQENENLKIENWINKKVRREFNKAKKIKRNVIVSGLPAAVGDTEEAKTAFDKANVEALITTLGSSIDGKKIEFSVDEIRRVKTNNDKLSLIVVYLGHEESQDLVLEGVKTWRETTSTTRFSSVRTWLKQREPSRNGSERRGENWTRSCRWRVLDVYLAVATRVSSSTGGFGPANSDESSTSRVKMRCCAQEH